MTANPWPGRAASIVVLPSGAIGDAIRDQAAAWARAGLLGAAFWVRPEDAQLTDPHSFSLPAQMYGPVNSVKVDVLAQLARAEFRRIRVVALRVAAHDGTLDDQQTSAIHRLHDVLQQIAPSAPSAAPGDDFPRTVMINLIAVPPWVGRVRASDAVEFDWDWNLLISMENRTTPFGIDAVIRTDDELVGVLLSNVASVAGLWVGVPASSVELLHTDASAVLGNVWVHRTFARGVIHQGLISKTAFDALSYVADPNVDLFDPIEGMQPTDLAPVDGAQKLQLLRVLVDETLKLRNQSLSYKRPPAYTPPSQEKIGIIQQMREFLAFAWDKCKLLPLLLARFIVQRLNTLLNRVFQGRRGKKQIDASLDIRPLRQDKRDLQLFSELEAISQMRDRFQNQPKVSLQVDEPTVPGLWGDLRRLLFASLDGSEGPEGVSMPHSPDSDLPLVLRRVRDLVFDPFDSWELPDEIKKLRKDLKKQHPISWERLSDSDEVVNAISSLCAERETALAAVRLQLSELGEELDDD